MERQEQKSSVVVYEQTTGHIVHIHHSVTGPGTEPEDSKTIETDALKLARRTQPDSKLVVMPVDAARLDPGKWYEVDTEGHALRETVNKPVGRN